MPNLRQIHARTCNLEVENSCLIQEQWEQREHKRNFGIDPVESIDLDRPEKAGTPKRQATLAGCKPRGKKWGLTLVSGKAAEQFGNLVQVEIHRRVEHSCENSRRLFGQV